MLVNTEAVIKARVTTGTSKYQASRGSLAAPSIVSAAVLLYLIQGERDTVIKDALVNRDTSSVTVP